MNINLLIEVVEELKAAADELKQKEQKSELEYGELLAFAEALTIIKDVFAGYNLAELGLDFDIDANYL